MEELTFADYIIPALLAAVILFLMGRRLIKTMRSHFGMKKFVKSAIQLDRKKYNGQELVEKIKRKRKRHTNAFQFLRGRAKMQVRRYLTHKVEELPVFVRYSYGSLFKRANNKLFLYVTQGKKTLSKVPIKKGVGVLIELTNQYNCLDELVNYLHFLPDAILDKQNYDIYVGQNDVTLNYVIK